MGLNDYGLYFTEPYSSAGRYYPIAKSDWGTSSFWFSFSAGYNFIDQYGTSYFKLRDSYWLREVLKALLVDLGLNLTFGSSTSYSLLFNYNYGSISGEELNLIISPKSNILASNYDQPAKKASITLGDIFGMLKTCFRAYWFIENGRLRIEHISWFNNGSSSSTETVQLDLTKYIDPKVLKPWAFGVDTIKYDKASTPKAIQFNWMDESTQGFKGYDIEMLEVNTNNTIETQTVNAFTTDIDYMLANSTAVSKDGFALMNVIFTGGRYETPVVSLVVDGYNLSMQNGSLSFPFLHANYYRYQMPTWGLSINKIETIASSVLKYKLQEVDIPYITDLDIYKLIKTNQGNGQIRAIITNLSSRMHKLTLEFPYSSTSDMTTTTTVLQTVNLTFGQYTSSQGEIRLNGILISAGGEIKTIPLNSQYTILAMPYSGYDAVIYKSGVSVGSSYDGVASANASFTVTFSAAVSTTLPAYVPLYIGSYSDTYGQVLVNGTPTAPGATVQVPYGTHVYVSGDTYGNPDYKAVFSSGLIVFGGASYTDENYISAMSLSVVFVYNPTGTSTTSTSQVIPEIFVSQDYDDTKGTLYIDDVPYGSYPDSFEEIVLSQGQSATIFLDVLSWLYCYFI